jgi:hypothetical protein
MSHLETDASSFMQYRERMKWSSGSGDFLYSPNTYDDQHCAKY